MTRAGAYGQSFALKHLSDGRYDEALAEADKQIAADPKDPEPVLDRAQILMALERFEDTVAEVERALELDRAAEVLDDSVVDDTLFSTLVAWGRTVADSDPKRAAALFDIYKKLVPQGVHKGEAAEWARRFQGERRMWVKEQE